MDTRQWAGNDEIAWCPGCGNFAILGALRRALADLGRRPAEVLLVSGIGQAAKTPHYLAANCFNGLHGRALPAAAGAKIANRALTVIVTTGDGDCYGEGGNHLLHNIRRNLDLTVIVHNNQVYGLTKGQASPTSEAGFTTKVQTGGVIAAPFHPLEAAIALGAGFVARGWAGDPAGLAGLIVAAVRHRGFALLDVLQPCVSFNRVNTRRWYEQRVYPLADEAGHDPGDRAAALARAAEWGERIPLGVIYQSARPTWEQLSGLDQRPPLVSDDISAVDLGPALADFAA